MTGSTMTAERGVELNESATLRALRDAQRCGAVVEIVACDPAESGPPSSSPATLLATASIVQVEGDRIHLRGVAGPHEPAAGAGARCWLRFRMGDNAFWLAAERCVPPSPRQQGQWTVVRTTPVYSQQRRRSRRLQLRRSTRVTLQSSGSPHSCDGAMLNVSADGLACRVRIAEADALSVGDRLYARFQLADERDAYAVDAELRGKGPAGTEDNAILRLEFCHHSGSQVREQLLRALSH